MVTHLKDVNIYLTRDRTILKEAKRQASLVHRFTAQDGDSGELVCKAEWGNVKKETYQPITVKGKISLSDVDIQPLEPQQTSFSCSHFCCSTPTELFSKPILAVQPADIFQGDRFRFTCSVAVYFPDRMDDAAKEFTIYRDGANITSLDTYESLATPSRNGNYTCKVLVKNLKLSIEKESPVVVVKAKGESPGGKKNSQSQLHTVGFLSDFKSWLMQIVTRPKEPKMGNI